MTAIRSICRLYIMNNFYQLQYIFLVEIKPFSPLALYHPLPPLITRRSRGMHAIMLSTSTYGVNRLFADEEEEKIWLERRSGEGR